MMMYSMIVGYAVQEVPEEMKTPTTAVGAELNVLFLLNMDVQNNIGTKLCLCGICGLFGRRSCSPPC